LTRPVVLFSALREPTYVRNALALRALREHYDVQQVTSDAATYPQRLARVLPRLLSSPGTHDVCYTGFLGQPLALWLRLCQRRPIVLDAFISVYDTLCFDRRQSRPWSPLGRLAYVLDRLATAAASIVVVDTNAQADYFSQAFRVPQEKLETIYVGYDSEVFGPGAHVDPDISSFHVFTYSSYLPAHGMDKVVRAASLLRAERRITFTLAGRGPTYTRARALADQLDLTNVQFVDWIPYEHLPTAIAAADVCLGGHFGTSSKAKRTIAGKTFQFLAMGRPTIVGDSPANHELLVPGEHAMFCQQGSPEALAQAIIALFRSPELRQHLGARGAELIRERFRPDVVSRRWAGIVARALGEANRKERDSD